MIRPSAPLRPHDPRLVARLDAFQRDELRAGRPVPNLPLTAYTAATAPSTWFGWLDGSGNGGTTWTWTLVPA